MKLARYFFFFVALGGVGCEAPRTDAPDQGIPRDRETLTVCEVLSAEPTEAAGLEGVVESTLIELSRRFPDRNYRFSSARQRASREGITLVFTDSKYSDSYFVVEVDKYKKSILDSFELVGIFYPPTVDGCRPENG